jgi:dihydrofolate reductase
LNVSLIVAMDEKSGIGKDNQLPWHLPSDLKRFKILTMGHHLIMGRKTNETIGKPLPGRMMIVVTRQKEYFSEGCMVVNSLKEAIKLADDHHETEAFIIGGGEIFNQAIGLADKIYITTVHTDLETDVSFPKIDPNQWELIAIEDIPQNDKDEYKSDFRILIRKH